MANVIDELLSIISPLAEQQEKVSQREMYAMRGYEDFYREHISGVENIYNNRQLLDERDSVVQYYNDNKNEMDEVNNDRFLRLIRKYDLQKDLNDGYDVGLERADDFSNQLYSGDKSNPGILDRYNDVNSQTEFMKKQYVNVGGGAHEWKDASYKPETEKELKELRDEERRKLIDEYSRLHQDYVQWHGEFSSLQGNRLTKNRATAFKLANLNEAYIFAAEQAEEDGIFDKEEASAYKKAAASGSLQPIDNYVGKETNFNRIIINRESSHMDTLYDLGSKYQNLLDTRNQWNTMSPDEQAEKGTQEAFKYGPDESLTAAWEDLGDPTSHAYQYLDKIYDESEDIKSQLRQKDITLSRTLGQSYLQAISKSGENKTWDSAFVPTGVIQKEFKPSDFMVKTGPKGSTYFDPPKPPEEQSISPFAISKKEESQIIESVTDKFGEDFTQDSEEHLKKDIDKYNVEVEKIDKPFSYIIKNGKIASRRGTGYTSGYEGVGVNELKNLGIGTEIKYKGDKVLYKSDGEWVEQDPTKGRMVYPPDPSEIKRPGDVSFQISQDDVIILDNLYKDNLTKMKSLEQEYYARKSKNLPVKETVKELRALTEEWFGWKWNPSHTRKLIIEDLVQYEIDEGYRSTAHRERWVGKDTKGSLLLSLKKQLDKKQKHLESKKKQFDKKWQM